MRRTVEYRVPAAEPWGACWNQVNQALSKARDEYCAALNKWPADDAIRVHVTDEAVVISFVLTEDKDGS